MIYLPSNLDTIERLWTLGDGTMCILTECEGPPRYAISLVRNASLLRHQRVYGRAAARVLAENWCQLAGGRWIAPEAFSISV
jgi:hypothetical protein